MDAEVQKLIDENQPYITTEKDGRVKCTLNNHVLPATKSALESFLNGKKYERLKKKADAEGAFGKYEPFIIPSKNVPGKLYCALTCSLVNKSMDSIKKHLKGKSFLKAKERFEKDEHDLMEEPDMEDSEPSDAGKLDGQQEDLITALMDGMDTEEPANEPSAPSNSEDDVENKPVGKQHKMKQHKELAAHQAEQNGSKSSKPQSSKVGKKAKKRQKREVTEPNGKAGSEGLAPVLQSEQMEANDNSQATGKQKRLRASGSRPKRMKRSEQ